MKKQQIIVKAEEDLAFAKEQMNRPEEDIVTLAVCQHARLCVDGLLKAFLLDHGKKFKSDSALSHLIAECTKLDAGFKEIDFSLIECGNLPAGECNNIYCMNLKTVKNCLEIAGRIERIVSANRKG